MLFVKRNHLCSPNNTQAQSDQENATTTSPRIHSWSTNTTSRWSHHDFSNALTSEVHSNHDQLGSCARSTSAPSPTEPATQSSQFPPPGLAPLPQHLKFLFKDHLMTRCSDTTSHTSVPPQHPYTFKILHSHATCLYHSTVRTSTKSGGFTSTIRTRARIWRTRIASGM